MGNKLSRKRDDVKRDDVKSDDVIIYKLFSNPTLLETLKQIESIEVFKNLESFCTDELQVCKFYFCNDLLL